MGPMDPSTESGVPPDTFESMASTTTENMSVMWRNNLDRVRKYMVAIRMWNDKKRLRYDQLPDHLKTHTNQTSFLDRYRWSMMAVSRIRSLLIYQRTGITTSTRISTAI